MSKLEKKLKTDMRKKMLDTNPSDELYERVKKELNMKEKQKQYLVNKPYKRWVPILATSFCILLAIVIGVIALNNKKVNAKEYNAIVQVDVNPSIQMVVDEENKVLYAKLFNEMTARKFESFSLTPESPISQYYLMLGMFNENMNASLALTTNHGWGPTYGEMKDDNTVPNGYTGDEIDGTYGLSLIHISEPTRPY